MQPVVLTGLCSCHITTAVCPQCYKLNRGSSSGWISMFSVNLTYESMKRQFFINDANLLFFFCKNRHFLGYKCVSIQNSTWILALTLVHWQLLSAECTPTCCYAAVEHKSIQVDKENRWRDDRLYW